MGPDGLAESNCSELPIHDFVLYILYMIYLCSVHLKYCSSYKAAATMRTEKDISLTC